MSLSQSRQGAKIRKEMQMLALPLFPLQFLSLRLRVFASNPLLAQQVEEVLARPRSGLCRHARFTKIRRPILGALMPDVLYLLGNGVPRLVDCAPLVAAACRR
jgi:hypothetical protein